MERAGRHRGALGNYGQYKCGGRVSEESGGVEGRRRHRWIRERREGGKGA